MYCTLKGIAKRFGRDWIVKDLDLEIASGTHVALLGSNGSGKSTLMRIIASQLTPSKGKMEYRMGTDLIDPESVYKHISFVAPYIDVYRQLTFEELLNFHFSLRNTREGIKTQIVIDTLDLPSDKPLSSFSSGMLQRVKLALAFVTESSLILLDEPTMNLDDKGQDWFVEMLQAVPEYTTVIIASNVPTRETSTCTEHYRIEQSSLIASALH